MKVLVAPDGGWGWMIVVAYAVCNFFIVPTIGSFGLIFKDRYVAMGLTATDVSLITNINAAFGMSMGLINGPLLRRFGCRRIGIAAGLLMSGGMCATATATTMAAFIVYYGLITAAGLGMALSAFSLALNQYFRERRNRAIGIGMTLTGLGPILYPPLIAVLLQQYGTGGCVLVLGAMCTHVVAAAMLLQPVEWHMRRKEAADVEMLEMSNGTTMATAKPALRTVASSATMASSSPIGVDHLVDVQSIYGVDHISICPARSATAAPRSQNVAEAVSAMPQPGALLPSSLASRRAGPQFERSISHVMQRRTSHDAGGTPAVRKPFLRWFESGSVNSVHLASSVDVFGDAEARGGRSPRPSVQKVVEHRSMQSLLHTPQPVTPGVVTEITSEPPPNSSGTSAIVRFFDLQLFADPIYVNIMLGMSLAIFAEINFSILTPFLLHDLGYTTAQIASCLSALAVADIVARFAAPFVGERLGGGARTMYAASLVLLVVTRVGVLLVDSFDGMLVACVALGVVKGLRTVYMQLVIPSYVPIERLASAGGLQMVVNGLVIMALGPVVGVVRDRSGSFVQCIWFINAVTLVTLSMWGVEFVCVQVAKRRQRRTKAGAVIVESTNGGEIKAIVLLDVLK